MKAILRIVAILLFPLSLFAQYPGNGNDWIDYGNTYYKIRVEQDGIYQITAQQLIDAGMAASDLNATDFKLFHNGEEVPLYTSSNGLLAGSDFIEFKGQKNDGTLDTDLYLADNYQPSTAKSLFSDISSYFLTLSPGTTNLRLVDVANDLTNLPAAETHHTQTVQVGFDDTWIEGMPYFIGGTSLYDSRFDEGEGFYSGRIQQNLDFDIPTPGVYTATSQAVTFNSKFTYWRYVSRNTSHSLGFSLGNAASRNFDWVSGFGLKEYNQNYLPSDLTNGITTLNVNNNGPTSLSYRLAEVTLTYPRNFDYNGESLAEFDLNNAGSRYFEIENMNAGSGTAIIHDVSSNERLTTSSSDIRFKTTPNSTTNSIYIATSVENVASISEVNFVDYSATSPNFIVVYHPSLTTPVNGVNPVQEYVDYRASAAGGSYTVEAVNILDIYDQYAYGIDYHVGALKNLLLELNQTSGDPEHVFIMGKGLEYKRLHQDNPDFISAMLVPGFGSPGSDNLFVTNYGNNMFVRTAIGRVAAKNHIELKAYVDKVITYENIQSDTSDASQTKDKTWMKQALHLGGGANSAQQNLFKSFLNNYENIIEDEYYGAKVSSVFKTSTDPIQIAESLVIDSLIDRGISLVTFFGHAAANVFEFNLRDPANYENDGKFPVILTNGCFVGNVFNPGGTLSESFVLEPEKGSIAFMGPIQFGIAQGMNRYSELFYRNTSITTYDNSVGENVIDAINSTTNNGNTTNRISILTAQQMIYHGDPAIELNNHAKPDYLVEEDDFQLNPSVITADDETFEVTVTVTNIGKALDEQVDVQLTRVYPDGSEVNFVQTVGPILYDTEVVFELDTEAVTASGINLFKVQIDPDGNLDEITTSNNNLGDGITTSIISNTVTPVFPYEFGVSDNDNLELKATSVQFYTTERPFIIEIDTTALFNSPFKRTTTINSKGGLLKWNPGVTYENERVYYWRARIDEDNSIWRTSSFVHLDAIPDGWNQSHYFQYLENDFASLRVDENRTFQFADNNRIVSVKTSIFPTINYGQMLYALDGDIQHRYKCPTEVVVAVFDENSGIPWENIRVDQREGLYESVLCTNKPMKAFLYRTNDATSRKKLMDMLDAIPDNQYVLIYNQLPPNPTEYNWEADATDPNIGYTLFDKLEEYGAQNIRNLGDNIPFVLFSKKNDSSFTPYESYGTSSSSVLDESIDLNGVWSNGTMETETIGPALSWTNLEWAWNSSLDNDNTGDNITIDVIGVTQNGTTTVLFDDVSVLNLDLSSIDASAYPYIKLKLNIQDPVNFSSPQLEYWRIIYEKAPELAISKFEVLNPTEEGDLLERGEKLKLKYSIENISDKDMTPVLVDYMNAYGNNTRVSEDERYATLPAGASIDIDYEFDTSCNCAYGKNSMLIDVNPRNDQIEQYHFNNIAVVQYEVNRDTANPYLDVTFDGIHIIDGDQIAETPSILITLTDENDFLALDDPEDFKIVLQEPGIDTLTEFTSTSPEIQFYPANSNDLDNNNRAVIEFNPALKLGEHTMIVQGKDKSSNNAGTNDYKVSFKVTDEDIITQIINYPNPFSTRTEFVANIVGDLPDQVLIQIFSTNGRVIKEIQSTPSSMGVSEGNNYYRIAEWDGRDDYGDPVGNGLYYYKVTMKRNGEVINPVDAEKYDEYFYNGLGKLYIVR